MKRISKIAVLVYLFVFASCEKNYEVDTGIEEEQWNIQDIEIENSESFRNTISEALAENKETHESDDDYSWSDSDLVKIMLLGDSISVDGIGAEVSGTMVVITKAGSYRISGMLTDGQIIVNTPDEEVVRLILNGINISNSNSSPIFIDQAEKTLIYLEDETESIITDASEYIFESAEEDEPNATLFSKDDLSIAGTGSLKIYANYKDGIASKDGLVINGGIIEIEAKDDGIRGKDYLIINDGELIIDAGGDGLKSDNDEDETRGYIYIQNGAFNIISGNDIIQAKTDILIENGSFNLSTANGSSSYSTESIKGLKASINLIIDRGEYDISATDDAIHSNGSLVINDGTYELATNDDAIHADGVIYINNGLIDITESFEGIESAVIKINGGDIRVVSSDDGVNIAGGNDGSGHGGPGMGGGFNVSSDYQLFIDGGRLAIYSDGDGIDANGYITMSDGTVIIHGPTANNNSALDFDGGFSISGGLLVAAGSAGMAQSPGSTSTQKSMNLSFNSRISGGTMIHIESSEGKDMLTFVSKKSFQSLVFSSPNILVGTTYEVYTGGSCNGVESDGLYRGGTYTAGSKLGSLTL